MFQVTKSLILRFFLLIIYLLVPILTYIFEARPFVLILARYTDLSIPASLTVLNTGPMMVHFIPIILYLTWIMTKMVRYPIKDPLKQKRQKKKQESEDGSELEEEENSSQGKSKKKESKGDEQV